ncbi:MAG TPA: tryptophan 7-halogenase [Cyclobacteriaceae bacterium]|nr:tryptophan 7-halogenase [Cyclobacteriaceae bacterium]
MRLTGTGYVFSSAFTTPEHAEREFRAHVGKASDNCNAMLIKMRIGRNRHAWAKNCVAIGLANAFVEPLESTGIFFIQHGIEELINNFPDKDFNPELVKRYNESIGDCVDGIRDFLILHYFATTRADSEFWRATKTHMKMSDELRDRFKEWKTHLPNSRNINQKYHGFESYSYAVMLQGLGYLPERNLPIMNHLDKRNALARFADIRRRAEMLCNSLPSQYEYLTSVRKVPLVGEPA